MGRFFVFALASLVSLSAQTRHPARFRQNFLPRPQSALVDPNDRVFLDLAAGGGWETIITFVNMSGSPAQFELDFYDDNGSARSLPLVNPDGSISRFASAGFSLDANTSSELVVANVDNNVRTAWAYLSASGSSPIAGMAVVRTKDDGGNVINESVESLANIQDYDFFAPYDNLEGVSTTLILVNSANVSTANVRLSAQDADGNEILRDRFQLAAGQRAVISLPDTYSALAGTSGKLRVTGDTNRLSGICYRTSPTGSVSYSPIFNRSGMFQ